MLFQSTATRPYFLGLAAGVQSKMSPFAPNRNVPSGSGSWSAPSPCKLMMATPRDPSRVREAKPYGPALDCSLAVAKTALCSSWRPSGGSRAYGKSRVRPYARAEGDNAIGLRHGWRKSSVVRPMEGCPLLRPIEMSPLDQVGGRPLRLAGPPRGAGTQSRPPGHGDPRSAALCGPPLTAPSPSAKPALCSTRRRGSRAYMSDLSGLAASQENTARVKPDRKSIVGESCPRGPLIQALDHPAYGGPCWTTQQVRQVNTRLLTQSQAAGRGDARRESTQAASPHLCCANDRSKHSLLMPYEKLTRERSTARVPTRLRYSATCDWETSFECYRGGCVGRAQYSRRDGGLGRGSEPSNSNCRWRRSLFQVVEAAFGVRVVLPAALAAHQVWPRKLMWPYYGNRVEDMMNRKGCPQDNTWAFSTTLVRAPAATSMKVWTHGTGRDRAAYIEHVQHNRTRSIRRWATNRTKLSMSSLLGRVG